MQACECLWEQDVSKRSTGAPEAWASLEAPQKWRHLAASPTPSPVGVGLLHLRDARSKAHAPDAGLKELHDIARQRARLVAQHTGHLQACACEAQYVLGVPKHAVVVVLADMSHRSPDQATTPAPRSGWRCGQWRAHAPHPPVPHHPGIYPPTRTLTRPPPPIMPSSSFGLEVRAMAGTRPSPPRTSPPRHISTHPHPDQAAATHHAQLLVQVGGARDGGRVRVFVVHLPVLADEQHALRDLHDLDGHVQGYGDEVACTGGGMRAAALRLAGRLEQAGSSCAWSAMNLDEDEVARVGGVAQAALLSAIQEQKGGPPCVGLTTFMGMHRGGMGQPA